MHDVNTIANITSLSLTHDQWQALVDEHSLTYTQKDVYYKRYEVSGQSVVYTGWEQEIIGYVDSEDDFYGIILGGTAAVSNDKRDDLEKVVNRFGTSYEDSVFTVGSDSKSTIEIVDTYGVRNTYAYLEPVKSVSWKATPAIDNNIVSGFVGDVYHIYGTDSYVVAVFDKSGNLYTWLYYYGRNNQLYTDWQ